MWNSDPLSSEGSSAQLSASPATRRRRRRQNYPPSNLLPSIPTMRSQGSMTGRAMSTNELLFSSQSTLPTHHGTSASDSTGTRSKSRRGSSWSKQQQAAVLRCLKVLLKPHVVIRLLGLIILGRLIYAHYYLASLSHQRTLWITKTGGTAGRLFEVVMSGSSLSSLDPSTMFASRPTSPDWLQERREGRMQRTRPGFVDEQALAHAGVTRNDHPVLEAAADNQRDWKDLCQQANMNSGSRVLIVHLLSHPTGAAVAKLIAKQCGVRQLIGSDPMLPNLRRTRMALMRIQKEVTRVIPDLQMIVTEPAMGLHEKNRLEPLAWVAKARPTHVLLLDPMESSVFVESIGGSTSFKMYALQQLRHTWQDLTMAVQRLPVRILHVASPLLGDISQTMGSASVASWDVHIPFSFSTLSLGPLTGPGIYTELSPERANPTFVEQGLRAIMTGWQRPKQVFSVNLSPAPTSTEQSLQISIWEDHLANPYSTTAPSVNQTAIMQTRQWMQTTGNDPLSLPCASKCQGTSSLRTCSATVWDHAIGSSVTATQGCEYALFMANFSAQLIEVPKHAPDPKLCRVFFISRKSPLAKAHSSEENGKALSNDWKLVWLDITEKSYTANDSAFLRIDPSRLFSPTVRKAMHVNTVAFAMAPDFALLNIMTQIDRPAVKEGERKHREVRRGTDLKRWKPLPAEPQRRVALFVGTPLPENLPDTLQEYKSMMGNAVSQRQVAFYLQLAHWVHVNVDRPVDEIQDTVYLKFPFEWTSRYFVVHDLTLETARKLRCDWMQEHLTWNVKPSYWDTEDLSLAFVLGALKTLEKVGLPLDEPEKGWMPFWKDEQEILLEGQDQVYLRLMQPRDD
eukprot:scaffold362_cov176-Amphora_coffeaeformis.AAC.22